MPEPQMRAADTDREAVVRRLGEHMAAGRLTVDEYEERAGRAWTARTYADLAELTVDLPSAPARPPAAASAATARPQPYRRGACGAGPWGWSHDSRQAAWASWFTTAVIVSTIWLISSIASGALLYFWPVWVIGPWGAVLLAQTLTGPRPHHDRRRLRA